MFFKPLLAFNKNFNIKKYFVTVRPLRIIVGSLAIYYLIFSIWTILSIETFSAFVGYQGDYFLKHINGVLYFSIGFILLLNSLSENVRRNAILLGIFASLGTAVIELTYLPQIGNIFLFWVDFVIEVLFGSVLVGMYFLKRNSLI